VALDADGHVIPEERGLSAQGAWQYAYRFAQKHKALALGTYPEVPLERARSRHQFARNLLAHGLDPSALKAALGKHLFIVTMREWEIARSHMSGPLCGRE